MTLTAFLANPLKYERPESARYTDLSPQTQEQINHLLDLLDIETGLSDERQRQEVSHIGAQILGIALPALAEIARCRGLDGDCPIITASRNLHDTTEGYRCEDCMPAFIREYGE
ncbi:hypothetical protein ACIF6L_34905 [Kitasatospora sp. NPDC086009]|uniref:hypothetical protein n=1 Tax=unclassified Kitasatospora TaxID=2633591 RepID=UPI0037CA1E20